MNQMQLREIEANYAKAMNYYESLGKKVLASEYPGDMAEAIQLKRDGRYLEASKLYAQELLRKGELYFDFGYWWFKVLACAGDIQDALSLLLFLRTNLDEDDKQRNWNYLAMPYLSSFVKSNGIYMCIEGINGYSLTKYISALSGDPLFELSESEINVPLRQGNYSVYIDMLRNIPGVYQAVIEDLNNYAR